MATEIISLTQPEPKLSDLVERVHSGTERLVITREGRAEAVLLSAEELDGLLETLEILSDNDVVRRLAEAEEELARGGGHALDEVRAEIRREQSPPVEPR